MGNACAFREDAPEEDLRAYDAFKRLHVEVTATLADDRRFVDDCHESFRLACTDKGSMTLDKRTFTNMTCQFIKRVQCDGNVVASKCLLAELELLCPGECLVDQAKFTDSTRRVLTFAERELRDKLNRLNQKNEGMFGVIDPPIEHFSLYSISQTGSAATAPSNVINTGMIEDTDSLHSKPVMEHLFVQRDPPAASASTAQSSTGDREPFTIYTFQSMPALEAGIHLIDSTRTHLGDDQLDTQRSHLGEQELEQRQREAMKNDLLTGNLHVHVYNRYFELEKKRLAVNAQRQLIAIFGQDGQAVASFEIRDLQFITKGISISIMENPPEVESSGALRFKDRFLCLIFDKEHTCNLALDTLSKLCGVPLSGAASLDEQS